MAACDEKVQKSSSVFFWTVNNEMKFYDLDADTERAKQKFRIVSDVVKDMRKTDPTRQYASTPTTYTTKPANALVITF